VFGQGLATEQLKAIVTDGAMDTAARREAFQSLADAKADGLKELAWKFIQDRDLGVTAIRVLATVGEPNDADRLIEQMQNLATPSKLAAIQTLSGRTDFIPKLLASVEAGQIAKDAVDASTLRQIQMSSDAEQLKRLIGIWPNSQFLNENKLARIRELEEMLATKPSKPISLTNGRQLWNKHCASCHRLFGEGAAIGPEITGAQRSNLRYVLENVVDPSASVADNFRVTLYRLENGQIITGVPINRTAETVTIQTAKEQVTVSLTDIEESKPSTLSLMPDGLLDALSESEQRDLINYVQSPVQVAIEP
jgi:putative heme-binding domain-containing protein